MKITRVASAHERRDEVFLQPIEPAQAGSRCHDFGPRQLGFDAAEQIDANPVGHARTHRQQGGLPSRKFFGTRLMKGRFPALDHRRERFVVFLFGFGIGERRCLAHSALRSLRGYPAAGASRNRD